MNYKLERKLQNKKLKTESPNINSIHNTSAHSSKSITKHIISGFQGKNYKQKKMYMYTKKDVNVYK